jgi:hypothetical protein
MKSLVIMASLLAKLAASENLFDISSRIIGGIEVRKDILVFLEC